MGVQSATHSNFRGDARAALASYHDVFSGELLVVTIRDMGLDDVPEEADQVEWGQVSAPDGFRVMAYDVPSAQPFERGTSSFFLSLRGVSKDEITARWERLAGGSTVVVPLAPAPWASLYGMLTDPHGITWVVDVVSPSPST